MRQLEAVENRSAGQAWDDNQVFRALLMAVLSANTDWSRIERIQGKLSDLFAGFSLESYAELSDTDIGDRFVPWFKARKAGSRTLGQNLIRLASAARKLRKYRNTHRTADSYFTSLMHQCDGDPKQAALRLGCESEYKLPSLGVPLAAEALKNLGFDVAKPDLHIMRAIGSFGLVRFGRWTDTGEWRNGRSSPVPTPRRHLRAMTAVQEIAEAAGKPVVLVDNAIWLLCAKSGAEHELYLTNLQLAEIASQGESPKDQSQGVGDLIRSWMDEGNTQEQRETIRYLLRALDEDRLSDRKLFPQELKGKSW